MDQEEKQLLEEANALRARELDISEKRTAALLAIGRALVVTVAALFAAWWGIMVLSQIELPWGRLGLLALGFSFLASFAATGWWFLDGRPWKRGAAVSAAVFVVFCLWGVLLNQSRF